MSRPTCEFCRCEKCRETRHIDRVMRFAAERHADVTVGFLSESGNRTVRLTCEWFYDDERVANVCFGDSVESAAKSLMAVLDGIGDGEVGT